MHADLLDQESSILQAIVDRDWDRLAAHLHDDFVITTAGWLDAPATKQNWLLEVATRHSVHKFKIQAIDVRDLGTVRVALVLSTQWATWKNEPFKGDFRYTDVWHADQNEWRLVVRHATLLPGS